MPQLAAWGQLPAPLQKHLIERMHGRAISLEDLHSLQLWVEARPEVPEGDWFRDFGSFKLCGRGAIPTTFLLRGQAAKGQRI